jgi:PAS domain S-box-containing protein
MKKKVANPGKPTPDLPIDDNKSKEELRKEIEELKKKCEKLEEEYRLNNKQTREKSESPKTENLIESLNSAIFLLQKTHTREEVFKVVANELKKLDIESLVMTASDDLKYLKLEYFSYNTRLIRTAEKVAKMTIGELKLDIMGIREYEDVLIDRKTVFVKNSVEFVKKILPKKLKFMAGQLIRSLKIDRFILSPLIVEDRVIGIFSVQGNNLLESEIPEVTMFAHQLAGIWLKVELLENARKEIEERIITEEKLKESTRKANTIINNIPGVVFRCLNDKNWTMEFISEGVKRITGYPASDFIKNKIRTYNSIIVTDLQESVWNEIQKGLSGNNPYTIEYKISTAAGDIRWIWEKGVGIYDNGNLVALEGYIADITEQKNAEEELNKSESRFRLFFSQSLDGYYYTLFDEPVLWNEKADKEKILDYANTNQRIVEINEAMLAQYGTTRDKLIGKPVSIFFEHETEYGRNMRRKLFDEGRLHIETDERRFDGTQIWIEGDYVCLYDEDKRITGTFGIQRDITKRKKAEEEIRSYTEKIEGIFKVAPAGIGEIKERVLTEVNPRICEMTGYSREELIGKSSLILYPSKEEFDYVGKEKYDQIREKGAGYIETKWRNKNGEILNIFLASTPLDNRNIKKGVIFTALDITSRIKAQEALARSEAKYRTLYQNSALAIGIRKTDGTYIEFNEAYSKMLGYSIEELRNLRQQDLTHPDDIKLTKDNMRLISERKADILKYEKRYIHKNGDIIWAEVCIQSLVSKENKIEAVIGTIVDITKRKRAEMRLKDREKSLEKQRNALASLATNEILTAGNIEKAKSILTEVSSDVLNVDRSSIWRLSENKNELICIDLFEKLKGVHSSGMVLKAKDYPNYFKALKENSQISVEDAQNDPKTSEFKEHYLIPLGIKSMLDSVLLSKDGIIGVFCFEHTGEKRVWHPHEESFANTVASLLVKTYAIDEAKEAEKHISMLANALESVNESVSITDTSNKIIYVNQAFTKTYGYSDSEIIGKNISILGSDKNPPGIHEKIHSTVIKGLWQGELINTKKGGDEFPIYLSSAPILDKKGNTIAFIGVANDITENKKAEEALRKAKEKAEEMNRIKSSFLANMSHEVRTPLVAILGFSELLSDMVKEPEIKNFVDMIHAGGVRLLDTLNLILDLSIIESQKMNIRYKEVEIVKEIKDTIALFEKFADKKNLKLKIKSEFKSLIFNSDEKIIRQILNNLINNGIKYTSNGGVTITLQKEKSNDKHYISIRVEDTGIGIPKEKQELIWEEFRQASEGLNRSFEGAGLGLSITKKFVEKLGGKIILEKSEVDIGSVFKVIFPVEEKVFQSAIYHTADEIRKVENFKKSEKTLPVLLYVDDDAISLDIVSAYTKGKFVIETALTGREGIEKAKSRVFDAVLIDINLGKDIDGNQLAKMIRELEGYANTPLATITAFAMEGDRERFLEKGFNYYISKPFEKADLIEFLEEVTGK